MSYNDLLNNLQEQVNSFSSYTNAPKKSVLNNTNLDVNPVLNESNASNTLNASNLTNSIEIYNPTSSQKTSKFNFFNNISKDSYIKTAKYALIILGPVIVIIICLLYSKPKFIYKDEVSLKNATLKWDDSKSSSTKICYKKLLKITCYIYMTLLIISCIFYFFYYKKRNVI
jgi:hypothetical protein